MSQIRNQGAKVGVLELPEVAESDTAQYRIRHYWDHETSAWADRNVAYCGATPNRPPGLPWADGDILCEVCVELTGGKL